LFFAFSPSQPKPRHADTLLEAGGADPRRIRQRLPVQKLFVFELLNKKNLILINILIYESNLRLRLKKGGKGLLTGLKL
jgi:hypothetical protein